MCFLCPAPRLEQCKAASHPEQLFRERLLASIAIIPTASNGSLATAAQGSRLQDHNTPGGLQSTATVLLLRLRATLHCPATAVVIPVGSLRWPGSFGGAGQTDSDATRKHWGAWHGSREKGTWTARQPEHMYRYLSIYWYTTSIVAFHVECRGLQLRSTRRACQQPAQLQRTPTVSASSPQVAPPPHVIHLEQREKKKFCYRVATEWINWINPHTPELLNTLTCHGQPPADLAIWGSSQLLLALPSILARPLALLSDGRDACGLQPQRPRSPEARQEGGKQKRSQRHGRLVTPMASAVVSLWPGLAWTGVASDEISRANAKQLAAAHSHCCPPPSPPLPSTA
ncbi:hypothetical protein Trihar35433_6455 [Trichoderma harzianum]|nr:hypothetical protein Trihar35433_6455 [Trichoderma harzianum]